MKKWFKSKVRTKSLMKKQERQRAKLKNRKWMMETFRMAILIRIMSIRIQRHNMKKLLIVTRRNMIVESSS